MGASYRDMFTPLWTPSVAAAVMMGVITVGRSWLEPQLPPLAVLVIAMPMGTVTFLSVSYVMNRRLVLSVASFVRNMV